MSESRELDAGPIDGGGKATMDSGGKEKEEEEAKPKENVTQGQNPSSSEDPQSQDEGRPSGSGELEENPSKKPKLMGDSSGGHDQTQIPTSNVMPEAELGCDDQLRVEPSVPQFENIPEVLLVEIFSRLPERAQLRLQAVCKSWCRLIPTVQPRGDTVYHLPTGDLLSDLASFMMPGEKVKAAFLRLGREKRGPMSFAVLKQNMKALRQTDLFNQRVVRLVSRGFKDIKEWTKEDVLEASKKY